LATRHNEQEVCSSWLPTTLSPFPLDLPRDEADAFAHLLKRTSYEDCLRRQVSSNQFLAGGGAHTRLAFLREGDGPCAQSRALADYRSADQLTGDEKRKEDAKPGHSGCFHPKLTVNSRDGGGAALGHLQPWCSVAVDGG
jgi:hypothetical protein